MKKIPILFSAPMVRAIRDGRKTQTRRLVTWPAWIEASHDVAAQSISRVGFVTEFDQDKGRRFSCPYGQPGDRLIVCAPIDGFGGSYAAGTDGVIYSKARGDRRPLKAHLNGNGYPHVTVMDGARKTTRSVHTLVCSAFYGSAPFVGAQVRHLDGNPRNSEPSNLAWGTQADNWTDRRAQGNGVEGEKHHAAKLNDEERTHVRWAVSRGLCSQRHAARALGMSAAAVVEMMNGAELRSVSIAEPGPRIPRITLEIISVRVELLNDISDDDALSEGVMYAGLNPLMREEELLPGNARMLFSGLWDSINAKRAPWASNPWVWVVEFKAVTP